MPTAYFILYLQLHLLYDVAKFVLSYPCEAVGISFYTGVYSVESLHHDLFLFWLSRNHLKGSFCGKYYTSLTMCKRLSTIRLMNAVSWRYVFASYIRSFCFYIPHKRPKLGGHTYKRSSAPYPIPGPLVLVGRGCRIELLGLSGAT